MRRLIPLLLVTGLTAAACGSDSDSAAETTATTGASPAATEAPAETVAPTTEAPVETVPESTEPVAPEVTAAELAATGPYAVGVTTRTLPEGGDIEIWYPADESARGGTDTYQLRTYLPEALAGLIPADLDDSLTIDATRDGAAAADGPFPLVLESHGAAGFRQISSNLARHLASWGMVVAATDHPSRDTANFISGTTEGQPPAVEQLRSMRTLLGSLDGDPILDGVVDADRVALGGHSAGGGTIAQLAAEDEGILGYVSYASGLREAVPDVPSLFMAGEDDMIVEVANTEAAFEAAPSPSWLWVFADTGHQAFPDVCLIGGGDATINEIAVEIGLGDFVDEGLRRLASDGCDEPNRPVQEVWPGVFQGTTGFYRWVFGVDAEPIGLDESVVTDGVTIASK
jgi:dienelactone hydrolase